MSKRYDAIIVGARLAGASAAAHLARQGARVLVLERAVFPAPTLSCPIVYGTSLACLDRLGLLEAVEAIGAPKIRHLSQDFGTFVLGADLLPYQGRDYAYSVRREVLDTAILRRVQDLYPVEVREGFAVTDLLWRGDQVVGVRGRGGAGREERLHADVVVGADGRSSLVARLVGAPAYRELPGHACVYYAYYRGFAPDAGASIYRVRDDFAVLVFPADDNLTVVAVGAPARYFGEFRADPEAAFDGRWRSVPALAARGATARRATPLKGQGPTPSFYRRPFGPGWALVGDAGYYKDPITGQGIHDALRSAELFAEAWALARCGGDWTGAMAGYQARRDAETASMYALTDMLARFEPLRPEQERLFRAIAADPDLVAQYVSIFNGVTDPAAFFDRFRPAVAA